MANIEAALGQWLASGCLETMSAEEAHASLCSIKGAHMPARKQQPLWRKALPGLRA